jgi:ferritin
MKLLPYFHFLEFLMLAANLHEALNKQINVEFGSAYLYLSMAAYFDGKSLDGFSRWMKEQAKEEVTHAMKIYRYLDDRECEITLLALPQPITKFTSVLDAFEKALEHERKLADGLNDLAGIALSAKDNTSYSFLEWFLNEQVEEVSTVATICDKIRMIGDNGHGVLMLNNELGQRKGDNPDSSAAN